MSPTSFQTAPSRVNIIIIDLFLLTVKFYAKILVFIPVLIKVSKNGSQLSGWQVANQKIFRKPLFDTFSYPVSKPSISNPLKMNGFIFHYILHHHIRQYHTCHRTAQGCQQRTCQCPAAFTDLDRHKIDRHRIEDCFRTAHH